MDNRSPHSFPIFSILRMREHKHSGDVLIKISLTDGATSILPLGAATKAIFKVMNKKLALQLINIVNKIST